MPRLQFRGFSCFSSSQGCVVLAAADSSLPGLFSLLFFSLHACFLLCDSFESKAHRMRILSSQKVQLSNTLLHAAPVVAISVTGYTIRICTHGKCFLVPVLHRNCFLCSYSRTFPHTSTLLCPDPSRQGSCGCAAQSRNNNPTVTPGLASKWLTPKRKKKQLSFNGKIENLSAHS